MIDDISITARFAALDPQLDERGRRLFAASEVRAAGRGGLKAVSRITGLARSTIGRGLKDLDAGPLPAGRVRRAGSGRHGVTVEDPTLLDDLRRLVAPATLGDPMRPLLWVSKSLRKLAAALADKGHSACPTGSFKEALTSGADSMGSVFGEGLSDSSEGTFCVSGEVEHGVAQGGHSLRGGAGADAALILSQDHVAAPVETVFDGPVIAPEGEKSIGSGLVGREAGDGIGDLATAFAALLAKALDPANLCGMGPIEMRDAFVADADLPHIDGPMAFLDGLNAESQIGGGSPVVGRG